MRCRPWHLLGAASLLFLLAACSESAPLPPEARLAPESVLAVNSPGQTTPVTSTIVESDPSLASSFQIRSDGGGVYTNSNGLTSTISNSGKWLLDSYFSRNSTRQIYLDFSRPIAGSGPNGGNAVAIPSGTYKFQAFADCPFAPYNTSFFAVAPGQTIHCPLHIGEIYVGAQKYSVHMNPNPGTEGIAWSESDFVNVTCTSIAAPCRSWRITPTRVLEDGSSANVAALLTYVTTTTKGKTTTVPVKQGDFYMSFRIDITNP